MPYYPDLRHRFTEPVIKDLLASVLMLTAYAFALSSLLPDGVNRAFAQGMLLITSVAVIPALTWYLLVRRRAAIQAVRPEPFAAGDLLLVLLPMTPIVQFLILNQDLLSWLDMLGIIALFFCASAVVVAAIPQLVSRWVTRSVVAMVGLSTAFVAFEMAALSREFNWHMVGDLTVQIGILLVVFAISLIVYRKDRRTLYGLVLFYFATSSLSTYFTIQEVPTPTADSNQQGQLLGQLTTQSNIRRTPDIFLLTYDSYVENETLLQYGIDNSEQENHLESTGFHIYRGNYSVAAASVRSMGRLLGGNEPQLGVAGHSAVLSVLEQAGYESHGVFTSDYFFRGVGIGYDHGFPPPKPRYLVLTTAILEGEFRADKIFEAPAERFVEQKRTVMSADSNSPKFLYTHSGPGHSQNSGACRSDETSRFAERLKQANVEMRVDIDTILDKHPDALIIVNGDHGPYLTKNCLTLPSDEYAPDDITPLDLQDRIGAFLAIRWPEGAVPETGHIAILQDVMPAVLAYLYDNPSFYELRIPQELAQGEDRHLGGVSIRNGHIVGGAYDGAPLYGGGRLADR